VLAACGGSKDAGPAPVMVSQMVTQAAGGTVAVGSSASLAIPANSLSGDTTITAATSAPAATLPNQDTLKGQYYDFGPDGTTFNPPATLTLPAGGTAPANAKPVISWYDGTKWNDLDTTVDGGNLTAPVAHFTGFVVRWVVMGVNGSTVDCSMPKAACGGDITGTWMPAGGCVSPGPVGNCTDSSSVVYALTVMGSAMFNADMTYSVSLPYSVTGNVHATPACLAQSMLASCAITQSKLQGAKDSNFDTLWTNATCTGDAATTGCDCTGSTTGNIAMNETGTYTVAGNAFTTTKTGGSTGNPNPYCVDGNMLWVQTKASPPEYLVFKK
jgi:hypothetical protein